MRPAYSVETLRVLAWPGYADPDVVSIFEKRTGARVEVTIIDSDAALWEKMNAARTANRLAGVAGVATNARAEGFDVFAVNTAELHRYVSQDLVLPLRRPAIPNLSRLLPRFRHLEALPGMMHDGQVFAVPYAYAEMGLIYDRNQVSSAPVSISALWDSRFRGRVLAYRGGAHNVSLAAQALKLADPFRLADSDWSAIADKLVALRRNVLTFYSHPDESVDLFMQRKAVLMLANYGSQQLKLLRQAGANVGYVIPVEGAFAWLDCWAIPRATRNQALAEAWINYLLEDGPGNVLQDRQGLSNATSESPYHLLDDRLIWLESVENAERRNLLWARIDSGYSAKKALAP